MTERLYYAHSKLDQFSARVIALRAQEDGLGVVLDRTAFYPTGGGQPHDTGLIAGLPVFDVREADATREVLHLMREGSPFGVGDKVDCSVNLKRRLDHMQQHTGQHILSQAFLQICRAATVGFHMGEASSTIDLDGSRPDESVIERSEGLANQIVFEDRPVRFLDLDREAADARGLRRETSPRDRVRAIEIEGFDCTACGGTHAERTGEVGLVLIRGWEKVKGHLRIDFVCGGRALREYREVNRVVKSASRLLTVGREDLSNKVWQLLEDGKRNRRRLRELAALAVSIEAGELAAKAEAIGSMRVARVAFDGRELDEIKLLAHDLADRGVVGLLGSRLGEAGLLLFSGPKEAGDTLDLRQCLKDVLQEFGGRGGGAKDFAQGALTSPENLESALDRASEWIAQRKA